MLMSSGIRVLCIRSNIVISDFNKSLIAYYLMHSSSMLEQEMGILEPRCL